MKIDRDNLVVCEKCGCVYDKIQATISENKTRWYGTDRTHKCPACGHTEETNDEDGYYR